MVILKFRMTINDQQNQYVLHLLLKSPWKGSHIGFHCSVQFWNFQILPKSVGQLPNSLHSSEWAVFPELSQAFMLCSREYLSNSSADPVAGVIWGVLPILNTNQNHLWKKSDPNFIKELTGVWNHTGLCNIKNICLKLTFGPIFAFIRSQI